MDQSIRPTYDEDFPDSGELQDLLDRLRPVVEEVLFDIGLSSAATKLDLLVLRLAVELKRDLGVA